MPRWPHFFTLLVLLLGGSLILVRTQEASLVRADVAAIAAPKDRNSSTHSVKVTFRKHSRQHNLTVLDNLTTKTGRSRDTSKQLVPGILSLPRHDRDIAALLPRFDKDRYGKIFSRENPLQRYIEKSSPRHFQSSSQQLPNSTKKGTDLLSLPKYVEINKYQYLKDKIHKNLGSFNPNETMNVLRRLKEITILGIAAQLIPNKTYYINIALPPLHMTQSDLSNVTLVSALEEGQKRVAESSRARPDRHNQTTRTDVMRIDISRTKIPLLREMNLSSNVILDMNFFNISESNLREFRKEYMKKYLELRRFVDTAIRTKASEKLQAGKHKPLGGVNLIKAMTLQPRTKPTSQLRPITNSTTTDKQGPVPTAAVPKTTDKSNSYFNIFSVLTRLFAIT